MVYTFLSGRIGNNLFQIATGASLAFRNNTGLIACITDSWCAEPDNCYLDEYLEKFRNNLLRKINFVKGIPEDALVFDQVFQVDQIPYYDKICLHGLWQSDNYFVKEENYIRDLFSIDEKTEKFIRSNYAKVFEKETISIVIRRGDYCKQPQFHPTCSMRYYIKAIKYFGMDKRYLIISDDIEWCKTKFRGDHFFFYDHISPVIDLYLQTYCTHNIISNSTFAWWGAWLNPNPGKIVIAPKENWYGLFYKEFYRVDMLPAKWIQIPNPLSVNHSLKIFRAIVISKLISIKHLIKKLSGSKIRLKK